MSFARPDDESKAFFASVLPDDPRIQVRPMFGNLAGFIKGNMFVGLFGKEVFVRLPEAEREQLLAEGASAFSPMPGRQMKEYVTFPDEWNQNPDKVRNWIERSLNWAELMPEKESKKQSPKTAKKEK